MMLLSKFRRSVSASGWTLFAFGLCRLVFSQAPVGSARDLAENGHWKQARVAVESLLRANANDAEGRYLLSRIKMTWGDFEGAMKEAERAVALNPGNADYHFQLAWSSGEMAKRAGLFTKMRVGPRFKKEVEAALAIDPNHFEARMALLMFYVNAPGIMGGDTKKAHALADELVTRNPEQGYFARALLAEEESDTAGMEQNYLKCIGANPRNYRALISLASYYRSDARKLYNLAEKYAREALKLEPDRGAPYSVLAGALAHQQRIAELEELLSRAEAAVPDNLNPYLQAGNALFVEGKDFPRAERYIRKYLSQEPEPNAPHPAAAHLVLGLLMEKQGRKSEAISEIETAVRLKPDYDAAKKALKRVKG